MENYENTNIYEFDLILNNNFFKLDYNFKLIIINNDLFTINSKNKDNDIKTIVNHNFDYILNIFKNHSNNLKKFDYNFLLNQHYDLNSLKLFFKFLLKYNLKFKKDDIKIKKYDIIDNFIIDTIDIFDIDLKSFDIKKIIIK